MRDLSRLLRPRSIALFGGGWAENVIAQLQGSGYPGADLADPPDPRRHPRHPLPAATSPGRARTPPSSASTARPPSRSSPASPRSGAGGAIAFASGFREARTGGAGLQARLVDAAGRMPVLGPNCYGLLNYLDNVTLWPDVHGGRPVDSGVAIVAQAPTSPST